jgi:hypothetical protein
MEELENKVSSDLISELSQKIFEKIDAHSSTFNERHSSHELVEAAVDHAWAYISHKDDEINEFIDGMKEEDPEYDLDVSKEEIERINAIGSRVFVEFVALRLQGMNEDSVRDLIREAVSDACIFVFTNRHIFFKLQEAQDERMIKMEKEIKRFKKYGKLELIKDNGKRKDSKKT